MSALPLGMALLLGLLALPGALTAESDALSPLEWITLRAVGDVAISPDGGHLAYRLDVPPNPFVDDDNAARGHLWLTDGEGNGRAFVTGDVTVRSITWMPGGDEIAYLAKREGDDHTSLYAIAAAGGESRKVFSFGSSVNEFAFSPDGKRLAFLAQEPQSKEEKALEEKGFDQEVFEEDRDFTRLWTVELGQEGAEPRKLEIEGQVDDLAWSPAGDRLRITLAPTPLVDDQLMRRTISFVDPENGAILGQVDPIGKIGQIAESRDGRTVAFVSGIDIHDPAAGRLMVASTGGGAAKELVAFPQGQVRTLSWDHQGRLLVILDRGVETELLRIGLDGRQESLVDPGVAIWGAVSASADGKTLALLGDTPMHPAEVFRLQPGQGAPQRVTDHNPSLTKAQLATQEVVEYEARDGLMIQGLLVRPRDEEKGQRYPLIMVVHGGPEAHFRNGWNNNYSRPGQQAAAAGYAVFYPNYRGSTGRGVDFAKSSQGDPAGKEFEDLIDGIDHLVKSGLVDREKVGITGGSYGGYASAWGATYYTEHFAAAVMFVGISNKVSKWGGSDIPNEVFLVHDRHWPWESLELLRERSPLFYAEKARTPILILHGAKDTRVPPDQSKELYRWLKVMGKVPVRLVLYPEEGHGNRRSAAKLDYNLRLMRWMDHYLKGDGGEMPGPEVDYPQPAEEAP